MQYESPTSIEGVVALLANGANDVRVLAGGTDLLVQLRAGIVSPDLVVDIKNVRETPELIGSTQIQGRASMGGNLCNASPAADTVPALIAAGATCRIAGPGGEREVPVGAICTGPGRTSLAKGEFVVSFFLPAHGAGSGDAYLRFIPRTEMDIAVVGAGVNLAIDEAGVCTAARVALGAVAPTAILVPGAGAALEGTKVEDADMDAMAAAASAACKPVDDKRGTIEYRTKVAGVMARRACAIALKRARSS
jgi:carbon-monoxide dehydrogenase medium subunit